MSELKTIYQSTISVDNVIFGFDNGDLKVLLIKRGEVPFKDKWALPGYYVYQDEDLDSAAERVLEELTGLKDVYLEQVKTFGRVDRHPLGRVITIAYYSLIKIREYKISGASMAKKAGWVSLPAIKELAFDHKEILDACFERLKAKIRFQPIGFELLPPKFTLTELQHLYEAILGKDLDKRNFRKKILSMKLLQDLRETQEGVAHRPAKLYRFNKRKYEKMNSEGANFEFVSNRSS